MTLTAMLLFTFIGIANLKHFFNQTSFLLNLFYNYSFINTINIKLFQIILNNSHRTSFIKTDFKFYSVYIQFCSEK